VRQIAFSSYGVTFPCCTAKRPSVYNSIHA
jgi:hypothetical protein